MKYCNIFIIVISNDCSLSTSVDTSENITPVDLGKALKKPNHNKSSTPNKLVMKIKKNKKFTKTYRALFNHELTLVESSILNLLVSFSNKDLKIFITNNGISKGFNNSISTSTIIRSIKKLKELGYITKSICNSNYEETGKWFNQRTIEVTDKTFDLINAEPTAEETATVEPIIEAVPAPVEKIIETPAEEETIQLEESAPVVEEETKAAPVVVEELINTKDVLNFIFPAIDTSQLYDYFYCVNRLEPEVTKSKLIELLSNNMTPVKAMLNYPEAYKDNSAYLNAFNSINDYSPEEAIEIIEAEQETTEQDKKVIMMNDHQKEIDENQKWFEELQAME